MPQVQFFLQNPNDFQATFASKIDIFTKSTASVCATLFLTDPDKSSIMKVSAPSNNQGVYKDVSVAGGIRHALDMAYKISSGQKLMINIFDQTNNVTISKTLVTQNTWANFYKEVTTPSTCRLVRLKLYRATAGTGKPFYIDSLRFWGNAFYVDPDDYTPDYQDQSQDHVNADGSITTDTKGKHAVFNMSFPLVSATNFSRIIHAGKGKKPTYFNDGFVPVITESYTVQAIQSRTFSNVTTGDTHKGYYTQTTANPLAVADMQGASFSNTDYTAIGADDSNYVSDAITGTGKYGYHKFNFRVTNYGVKTSIKKIYLEYKGLSQDNSNNGVHGVNLYAWNGYSWVLLKRTRTADKQTLTFETAKQEQAAQFVDVTNGWVKILVQTRATKDTAGTLTLKSYYVQAKVNEDMGHSITLLNKALLTANGSVAVVKNLTSNTTLNLNATTNGYTVGDDRKSITVTNDQASNSVVQVKYNQYYNVYIDQIRRSVMRGKISQPYNKIDLTLKTITPIEKV